MDSCPEIDRIVKTSRMRSHLNRLILNRNIASLCHKKINCLISNIYKFDAMISEIPVTYTY